MIIHENRMPMPSEQPILQIRNLRAGIEGKEILRGVHLTIYPGELHAIMGPNGSGKSTLAYVLAGSPRYEVYGGEVLFLGEDLLEMEPEERAQKGLFLAFQHPLELPGVSMVEFMRVASAEVRQAQRKDPYPAMELLRKLKDLSREFFGDEQYIRRSVNEGFSGGERKKNEILQMTILEPRLAILDEPDSGLDVDALRIVAQAINRMRSPDRAFILITHYSRILRYVVPDYVHVMYEGRIVQSGSAELAERIEQEGYDGVLQQTPKTVSES